MVLVPHAIYHYLWHASITPIREAQRCNPWCLLLKGVVFPSTTCDTIWATSIHVRVTSLSIYSLHRSSHRTSCVLPYCHSRLATHASPDGHKLRLSCLQSWVSLSPLFIERTWQAFLAVDAIFSLPGPGDTLGPVVWAGVGDWTITLNIVWPRPWLLWACEHQVNLLHVK